MLEFFAALTGGFFMRLINRSIGPAVINGDLAGELPDCGITCATFGYQVES